MFVSETPSTSNAISFVARVEMFIDCEVSAGGLVDGFLDGYRVGFGGWFSRSGLREPGRKYLILAMFPPRESLRWIGFILLLK